MFCIADVYAMNAEAVSALALCVLPYGPEHMVGMFLRCDRNC
jgi:hypothetical protein